MRRLSFLFIFISTITSAQQWKYVDFKEVKSEIEIDAATRTVSGIVEYRFDVKKVVDTIYIDAINMTFSDVSVNGKSAGYAVGPKSFKLFKGFKKGTNVLKLSYQATPKQTMYFTGSADNRQIWTQGQGKYTSHWLPSFDDVNEKAIFKTTVKAADGLAVLSNGILKGKTPTGNSVLWHYEMDKPMSSYLVMIAIGKFDRITEQTASGVPIELYFRPEDASKAAPTYRHSKEMFDFLEKEIGVAYPWSVYRQVPVMDFLYAGMENTTATIFAQDFVVDETGLNDRSYVNVNAHELAHQWFGNLVTAESGKHHWLQEGFATYYALLAERQLFGDDYFYYYLYDMAVDLKQAARTDTIPVLNEKASSLTFYRKGAWALHVLREGMGEDKFRKAVVAYLKKHAFGNVNTDEFIAEVKKVSKFDTASWKKKWLETGGFDYDEAIQLLTRNGFMKKLLEVQAMQMLPMEERMDEYERILKSDIYYPVKEEVVFQLAEVPFDQKEHLIKLALDSGHIKIRQAVAQTMKGIPANAYPLYVTLLDDASYITKEIALNMLYGLFPEKRQELLDKTDTLVGMNDRNLRILWLTLALSTEGYRQPEKVNFYDELIRYAGPEFESTTRQNALKKLLYLNPQDTNLLKLLVSPLTHHRWQFSKYARDTIRALVKKDVYRNFFTELLSTLPEAERQQLERLL